MLLSNLLWMVPTVAALALDNRAVPPAECKVVSLVLSAFKAVPSASAFCSTLLKIPTKTVTVPVVATSTTTSTLVLAGVTTLSATVTTSTTSTDPALPVVAVTAPTTVTVTETAQVYVLSLAPCLLCVYGLRCNDVAFRPLQSAEWHQPKLAWLGTQLRLQLQPMPLFFVQLHRLVVGVSLVRCLQQLAAVSLSRHPRRH
jgi:hypothetical protein